MNISPFESIGLYEFNRKKKNNDITSDIEMVVFNVDNYSVGFCKSNQNGQIAILTSKILESKSSCIEDINAAFQNAVKKKIDIFEYISPHLDSFNEKMKIFYQSERQMNSEFKDIIELDFDCSRVEDMFSTSKKKIEELLNMSEELWEDTKFDEEKCEILIVGKAALLYPIKHYIKEFLTFDPFLPDDRFVSDTYSDGVDEIVNLGMEEYKRKQEQELFITVFGINNKRNKRKIPVSVLSENGGELEYSDPIFITVDDRLKFEINSKKINIDIPYSIAPLDCDLIEIGACMIDSKLSVRLRRYNHPTRIYDIPVV